MLDTIPNFLNNSIKAISHTSENIDDIVVELNRIYNTVIKPSVFKKDIIKELKNTITSRVDYKELFLTLNHRYLDVGNNLYSVFDFIDDSFIYEDMKSAFLFTKSVSDIRVCSHCNDFKIMYHIDPNLEISYTIDDNIICYKNRTYTLEDFMNNDEIKLELFSDSLCDKSLDMSQICDIVQGMLKIYNSLYKSNIHYTTVGIYPRFYEQVIIDELLTLLREIK